MKQRIDDDSQAYLERAGQRCAYVRWTLPQRWAHVLPFLVLLYPAITDARETWIWCTYGIAAFYALIIAQRVLATALAVLHNPARRAEPDALAALRNDELPSYTVLVPLYREPEVAPQLVEALRRLDYPIDKLDVQFLVEPDDHATRRALRAQALPNYMRMTVSPPGEPRTKPRACNLGLQRATGEFLVIYDAEDQPEPDQLKKAVLAYRDAPASVVCLQCRLGHYNSRQSIYARWAAMEYLLWFRFMLPGLQMLRAPIPLGGTSNHFRVAALRELHGWDPFNVTEDCDLGMRISRKRWRVWMLDSTTWEEAVTTPVPWIKQRSRWIKGYWQTWLVHARFDGWRELGPWRGLHFALTVGGSTLMLLLNPLMWAIVIAWLVLDWPLIDSGDPFSRIALVVTMVLLGANLFFLGLNMVACLLKRRHDLVLAALLAPVEWVLLSIAAWFGFVQFFTSPFHWEKTAHGSAVRDRRRAARLLDLALPLTCFGLLAGLSVWSMGLFSQRVDAQIAEQERVEERPDAGWTMRQLPRLFELQDYLQAETLADFDDDLQGWLSKPAGIIDHLVAAGAGDEDSGMLAVTADFPEEAAVGARIGQDWSAYQGLSVDVWLPEDAPQHVRVMLHLRERDRLWYQHLSPQHLRPGEWTRIDVDLRGGSQHWETRGHGRPWDGASRQQVRTMAVRFFSEQDWSGTLRIDRLRLIPGVALRPLTLTDWQPGPASLPRYQRHESAFTLSRVYDNPFDPEQIDAVGVFTTPSGRSVRIPAFYYQNYRRELGEDGEELTPVGRAEWRLRFAPDEIGTHRFHLEVTDRHGDRLVGEEQRFEATPSAEPGFTRLAEQDHRYLRQDNGAFFWPIGHNICHPVDQQEPYPYDFERSDDGTFTFDRYFERMAAAGENWGRVWLTHWWLGLEGDPDWQHHHGLGRYNLAHAWRLDHLLERAEQLGLRLTLTVNHKSEFKRQLSWRYNPYNRANGGFLQHPIQFFTDPRAKANYKQLLRYLVARWGHSTSVMAWELWGEVNLVDGYNGRRAEVGDWHAEMGRYLRGIDPYAHPIFSHTHNWQRGYQLWALPEIECVQGNGYIRPPNRSTDHTVNFAGYLREVQRFRKPVFVAEYGGRSELGAPDKDYLEAQLHSGIWSSLCFEFGGCAAQWWWDFIDGEDMYRHYRGLAAFAADIDRLDEQFAHVTPRVRSPDNALLADGMHGERSAFYWVHHHDIFENWDELPPIPGGVLLADGLAPGRWRVVFHDTMSGEPIDERSITLTGRLELQLPRVHRDLAIKLHRADAD